jgi:hypothetical protein
MFAQVKPDPDAPTPYIKPDPDNKDTVLADIDEDIYDDDGDLDFSNAGQNVWLSRIPRSLWEHWASLDDDEEIQIGTMRIEGPPNDIKRVSSGDFGLCLSIFLFVAGSVVTSALCRSVFVSTNEKTTAISPRTTYCSDRPSTRET